MNMDVVSLTFKKLELDCAVYGNGFLKYMVIREAYAMNLSQVPVIGSLNNMVIDNSYINEFSFDENEALPMYELDGKNIKTTEFNFNTYCKNW